MRQNLFPQKAKSFLVSFLELSVLLAGMFRDWKYQRYSRKQLRTGKGDTELMKCGRRSEECCKEAKFEVDVYAVKRVDKGRFFRYERSNKLSKLFFCEDHAAPFYQDKLNYEIIELKK
jgi:hypothetical protein